MSEASSKTILIIQTAFIGDTILASHFIRAVKDQFPDSKIHFFLRKGNESVIQGLSSVEKTWIWDKQGGKVKNLIQLIRDLRKINFDIVFNLHRHFNSGLVSALMKSQVKIGFKQNPLSFFYTHKINHVIPHHPQDNNQVHLHEIQRNMELLKLLAPGAQMSSKRPELALLPKHFEKIAPFKKGPYFVLAPASVWFTKAWSEGKFHELTKKLSSVGTIYFIGAPSERSDKSFCERLCPPTSGFLCKC